jgi:hypothetical protein
MCHGLVIGSIAGVAIIGVAINSVMRRKRTAPQRGMLTESFEDVYL